MESYRAIVDSLLRRLNERSLDSTAALAGGRISEDRSLEIRMLGDNYRVCREAVMRGSEEAPAIHSIILLNHLLTVCAPQSDEWISFAQIPGAIAYEGSFRQNVEVFLGDHAASIIAAREDLLARFDGEELESIAGCDLAVRFRALPQVGILTLIYQQDEEFPSGAKVLFDKNAPLNIPIECLADLAEVLVKRLVGHAGREAG